MIAVFFVVLARSLRLRASRDGPEIRFSVGRAYLEPGGDLEAAIRAADEAMYADKHGKARRLRAV